MQSLTNFFGLYMSNPMAWSLFSPPIQQFGFNSWKFCKCQIYIHILLTCLLRII
jgi:hypothetical protein